MNRRFFLGKASLDEDLKLGPMIILDTLGGIGRCALCLRYWVRKARPDKFTESARGLAHFSLPGIDVWTGKIEEIPSNVGDAMKFIERGHKKAYPNQVKKTASWNETDDAVSYLYTILR